MHYLIYFLPLDIFILYSISQYKMIHSGFIYQCQETGDIVHLVHLM